MVRLKKQRLSGLLPQFAADFRIAPFASHQILQGATLGRQFLDDAAFLDEFLDGQIQLLLRNFLLLFH